MEQELEETGTFGPARRFNSANGVDVSFRALFESSSDFIFKICLIYVRDKGIAKNLTEKVFMKIFSALPDLNDFSESRQLVIITAIKTCKDFLREKDV